MQKSVLLGFLEGRISLEDMKYELRHSLEIDFSQGSRSRKIKSVGNQPMPDVCIQVQTAHLQARLIQYRNGEISGEELSDWAAFVFLSEFFVPSGESEQEQEVNGEGVLWDLLQRLMKPAIFDGLTIEVAEEYLYILKEKPDV